MPVDSLITTGNDSPPSLTRGLSPILRCVLLNAHVQVGSCRLRDLELIQGFPVRLVHKQVARVLAVGGRDFTNQGVIQDSLAEERRLFLAIAEVDALHSEIVLVERNIGAAGNGGEDRVGAVNILDSDSSGGRYAVETCADCQVSRTLSQQKPPINILNDKAYSQRVCKALILKDFSVSRDVGVSERLSAVTDVFGNDAVECFVRCCVENVGRKQVVESGGGYAKYSGVSFLIEDDAFEAYSGAVVCGTAGDGGGNLSSLTDGKGRAEGARRFDYGELVIIEGDKVCHRGSPLDLQD